MRLAEEKGRKDLMDWLTWRTGAVLAPGIINFTGKNNTGGKGKNKNGG